MCTYEAVFCWKQKPLVPGTTDSEALDLPLSEKSSSFQAFITFVYAQAMVNWVCVKRYTAGYRDPRGGALPRDRVWEQHASAQHPHKARFVRVWTLRDHKFNEMGIRRNTDLCQLHENTL